ncbi:MAG: hypothetical protein Q8R13_02010 [bacterium]|nr:hypothetical protein [bacterium]MDZ4295953.1 hypothetical protein [Patescibacteria group bacterium]
MNELKHSGTPFMLIARRLPLSLASAIFIALAAPFFTATASLGEQVSFTVASVYDIKERETISATLRYEGTHAHYYVEEEYWQSLGSGQAAFAESIKTLSADFDNHIYPLEHQYFGSEWNPGIDGDPRITVLITPMISEAGGYFLIGNEFLKTQHAQSNEREMVYINALSEKVPRWREFLAHELQHLITFGAKERRIDENEDIWLNELRSEVAVTLLGYDNASGATNVRQRAFSFTRAPNDSLVEWRNENADYAVVNVFGQYLLENHGWQLFKKTVENDATGIASVDRALRDLGSSKTFAEVYADWLRVAFLGGYQQPALRGLRLNPSVLYNISDAFRFSTQAAQQSWSISGYGFRNEGSVLEVTLESAPTESWLITVLKRKNPLETLLAHQFSGSKTISIATADAFDKDVIIIPVNTTATSSNPSAEHVADYRFAVRSAAEGFVTQPLTPETPTSTPSVTPTPLPGPVPVYPEGTLIRERGDVNVWIVKANSVRRIWAPPIFTFYGHLRWENILEVEPGTVARFQVSRLIREAGDGRVYEVDASGVKHWLNMTPLEFTASGRSWEAVYVVNARERDFYSTGAPATF